MFELDRRGNVRKMKYLERSDIVNIAIPSIGEILKNAKQNVLYPTFGNISWHATAIEIVTKGKIRRKESLNILAKVFGYRSINEVRGRTKANAINPNDDYDPNENILFIYENEQGEFTHVGISYN